MTFNRWSVVWIRPDILGLDPEGNWPAGVVVSSKDLVIKTGFYWVLVIPVPAPHPRIEGDIEVPVLAQNLWPTVNMPAVVRTSYIVTVHQEYLYPADRVELPMEYRELVTRSSLDKFLPRRP